MAESTVANGLLILCGCGHTKAEHNHHTDFCWVDGCVGCCEFIPDIKEWREAKERWDYEADLDEQMMAEAFHQEQQERKQQQLDNEYPSGSTDLGNRGGTVFCH